MAEDVAYADLKFSSEPNSPRLHRLSPGITASQYSHCHWIAFWTGWVGNVILVIAVIVLALQTKKTEDILEKPVASQKVINGRENNSCLENVTLLRLFFCKPLEKNLAESSSCYICPESWSNHKKSCYWVSKKSQAWHKSQEDCSMKHSQMVVIKNQEELAFIQNITSGAQLFWIGLQSKFADKKWIWVDDSTVNDTLLQDLGPVKANSCGRLNGDQIISELCSHEARWICEKKALLI